MVARVETAARTTESGLATTTCRTGSAACPRHSRPSHSQLTSTRACWSSAAASAAPGPSGPTASAQA